MLSLVLPTYNEAENLPRVLPELAEILKDLPYEIIVVDDDSTDHTWRVAERLSGTDLRVRVIRRVGRRGLSTAVMEGFAVARGDVLAAADADGQHDLRILPEMYRIVKEKSGIAVGSRYVPGGSVGEWDERRHVLSRVATRLSIALCRVKVRDPMSGFFAVDRKVFEAIAPTLHPKGFKILFDILLRVPARTPAAEVPYTFRTRTAGASKLSLRVQWQFLASLLGAAVRRIFTRSV